MSTTNESLLPSHQQAGETIQGNSLLSYSLGFIIFGVCVMNATVGALCISDASNIKSTGQVFLALYMILFAGLLFSIELNYLVQTPGLNEFIEENLGFAQGPSGIGGFLFFIGLMGFGLNLAHPKYLDILAAIVTCSVGILLPVLYCAFPKLFPKRVKKST